MFFYLKKNKKIERIYVDNEREKESTRVQMEIEIMYILEDVVGCSLSDLNRDKLTF
jgi:hypothetical protein